MLSVQRRNGNLCSLVEMKQCMSRQPNLLRFHSVEIPHAPVENDRVPTGRSHNSLRKRERERADMRAVSNKNLNKRSRVICSSELFSTQNMEGTGSTTLHRAAYSASVLVVPWVSPWSPMCTEGTVVPWPPQGRNRGAVQWRPPPHNPNPSLAPKSHH